jgi:hypothetical protein
MGGLLALAKTSFHGAAGEAAGQDSFTLPPKVDALPRICRWRTGGEFARRSYLFVKEPGPAG